ncbi:hypothetical protein, partial [Vibrio tasmaniensis]
MPNIITPLFKVDIIGIFIIFSLSFIAKQGYNAQLSSQKRTNAVPANYPKHKTQRKLKMPRVFGLLELFVERSR